MNFGNFLTGFAVIALIFLLCREVMCWYWKTNIMISLLTEIRDELKKFNKRMGN